MGRNYYGYRFGEENNDIVFLELRSF